VIVAISSIFVLVCVNFQRERWMVVFICCNYTKWEVKLPKESTGTVDLVVVVPLGHIYKRDDETKCKLRTPVMCNFWMDSTRVSCVSISFTMTTNDSQLWYHLHCFCLPVVITTLCPPSTLSFSDSVVHYHCLVCDITWHHIYFCVMLFTITLCLVTSTASHIFLFMILLLYHLPFSFKVIMMPLPPLWFM